MGRKYLINMQPEKMYHIWAKANGSENLFLCKENYHFFLRKYQHHISPIAKTFAYCLMPNHIHFMVQIRDKSKLLNYYRILKDDDSVTFLEFKVNKSQQPAGRMMISGFISKQFSNLFNGYTKSFNKVYERSGSLFQRPFKRKEVVSSKYYADLITYIHRNPIHHGYVENAEQWPFSSFNAVRMRKPTKLRRDEVLGWFGDRDCFIQAHQ